MEYLIIIAILIIIWGAYRKDVAERNKAQNADIEWLCSKNSKEQNNLRDNTDALEDEIQEHVKRNLSIKGENKYLQNTACRLIDENETLKRQLANRKGQITKLKNKIKSMEGK